MRVILTVLLSTIFAAGCAHRLTASAPSHCYTEAGWLDSTNGCSVRAGYPDCYLVCPETGERRRL
jgi:hypothetical protein